MDEIVEFQNFYHYNPSITIILRQYILTDVYHQGDSGGPLTHEVTGPAGNQSFLIGITSWGIGCGEVNIRTPGLSEQLRSNSAGQTHCCFYYDYGLFLICLLEVERVLCYKIKIRLWNVGKTSFSYFNTKFLQLSADI